MSNGADLLEDVTCWWRRFVRTMTDADHDLLTLWAVHSHLAIECYTTPRLQIDSPMPGSGKTTTLEHLARLCLRPVSMASVSSPALLTRMLDKELRTVLIDEADRSLSPDLPGVGELLAVINSGYKRGATRPVLVPVKGGGWEASEMPTFAPVALAGNQPSLPDDTRSRIIRVLLLPDLDGTAEESDWELIEDDAAALAARIAEWADAIRDDVRTCRPALPGGITGRLREKWGPLARIAEVAGGRWPATVAAMALADKEQYEMDRQDGLIREKPAILLQRHLREVWPGTDTFAPSEVLIAALVDRYPNVWGAASPFGKELTPHRLARMLASNYKINSARPGNSGQRGYVRAALEPVWNRFAPPPGESGESGSSGESGDLFTTITIPTTSTTSTKSPQPEPVTAAHICRTCGKTSSLSLIDGRCRNCRFQPAPPARNACQSCGTDIPEHHALCAACTRRLSEPSKETDQ